MTLYIGVDLHPHQQTAAWCDTRTGETETVDLRHDLEAVRKFYSGLSEPAVVGIEASSRQEEGQARRFCDFRAILPTRPHLQQLIHTTSPSTSLRYGEL